MASTAPTSQKKFVDIANARVDEQRAIMRDIIDAAHCPFCQENLQKYHKQPILKEGEYWLVTTNQWPYQHTKHHFLIILKRHIEHVTELLPDESIELIALTQWAVKKYAIPGGGLAMRFGDTDYSAGSVAHLHAQLLQPSIEDLDYDNKPLRVKIGKTWKDRGGQP